MQCRQLETHILQTAVTRATNRYGLGVSATNGGNYTYWHDALQFGTVTDWSQSTARWAHTYTAAQTRQKNIHLRNLKTHL